MKKKKNDRKILLVLILISATIGILYLFLAGSTLGDIVKKNSMSVGNKSAESIKCTRTTRLENSPRYDRALSIIAEKYSLWEVSESKDINNWIFFPSELINCIKIVEGNTKEDSGVEGYFVFNSPDIKKDYFPITVDVEYRSVDDLTTALLLVHEITHVQQYLDTINGRDKTNCIEKETEAFYAQWKLYGIMTTEEWKSITSRIENDENLQTQLKILDAIKNTIGDNFEKDRQMCFYGSGKNDSNCIDTNRKNAIKELITQDDYYQRQCEI